MVIVNVLYTKIVDDEDEEDGPPFVSPNSRGGDGLVVPRFNEVCFKDIIDNHISQG